MTEPKPCNKCGVPITFRIVEGKPKPFNVDGSAHLHLKPAPAEKPAMSELKGEFRGVTRGQIGIKRKDGAILMMSTSCKPDPVIKEGDRVIATIEHDSIVDLLLDPEHYVTKEPAFKNGKQILQENLDAKKAGNPACFPDSSDLDKEREAYNARATTPPQTEINPMPVIEPYKLCITPEVQIREAMKMIMPSEKVGYRISLAGCVNSVIEMYKIGGYTYKTYTEMEESVKRDAVALFLWMDGLTTQNIKAGV